MAPPRTSLRHKYPKEFWTFRQMRDRCYNPNNKSFYRYGGRGIKICDKWLHNFQAFVDDMGRKPAGMQIDRINNDGNYEPTNCRWATRRDQAHNRATTIHDDLEWVNISIQKKYHLRKQRKGELQ